LRSNAGGLGAYGRDEPKLAIIALAISSLAIISLGIISVMRNSHFPGERTRLHDRRIRPIRRKCTPLMFHPAAAS
jgi:hypothetical protein